MLKWAREHGCPWHPQTTLAAASFAHSVLVKKSEKGYDATINEFAQSSHFEVLRWVLRMDVPGTKKSCKIWQP